MSEKKIQRVVICHLSEETYNLDQDEALLEVKKLVDSWASMRGLIQEKSARDVM